MSSGAKASEVEKWRGPLLTLDWRRYRFNQKQSRSLGSAYILNSHQLARSGCSSSGWGCRRHETWFHATLTCKGLRTIMTVFSHHSNPLEYKTTNLILVNSNYCDWCHIDNFPCSPCPCPPYLCLLVFEALCICLCLCPCSHHVSGNLQWNLAKFFFCKR